MLAYRVAHDGAQVEVRVLTPRAAELHALMPFKAPPDLSRFLLSPMPGLLVDVAVRPGQAVRAGEQLAVIEAMKMENILVARSDGVVAQSRPRKGDEPRGRPGHPRVRVSAMSDRAPLRPAARSRVLGIQQVAIGGPSKAALRTLWVDLLGLEVTGSFRSERENVDEDICALGSGAAQVEVDLMEPIDPGGKPAVHATPLNHIGLWIDDLPAAVAWLAAHGVRFAPGGIRHGAAGHDICFVHPRRNDEFPVGGEGVLIELVQAPPLTVIAAFSAS